MLSITLRALRICVWLAWFAATLGLVILIVLPHALPAVGRQAYVVRGGSMEPAIPIGSLVVDQVHPEDVQAGQVITVHPGNGTIVTHRVVEVSKGSELAFTTRGDASGSADPVDIPASAVDGSVELIVPGAGYLLTALGSISGVLASIGLLGALLLAGWFTDEFAASLLQSPTPTPVGEPVQMNGDSLFDISLAHLLEVHDRHRPAMTLALARVADGRRYGAVTIDGAGVLLTFNDKPAAAASVLINGGIYVIERPVLDLISADRPVSLERDVIPELVGREVRGVPYDGYFVDIGVPEDYLRAQSEGWRFERFMNQG